MPLRSTLTTAWKALKEDWKNDLAPPLAGPLPRSPSVTSEAVSASDPLALTATMHQELTGLATQRQQLHTQLTTLAQALGATPHTSTLTTLLRLLTAMETTVETMQIAHTNLERTLRDKRQLLSAQEETLTNVAAEKATMLHTIDTLLQDRAQEAHALQRLQERVPPLEARLTRSHNEFTTLSHAHDDLVAKHHQLFLAFQTLAQEQTARVDTAPGKRQKP